MTIVDVEKKVKHSKLAEDIEQAITDGKYSPPGSAEDIVRILTCVHSVTYHISVLGSAHTGGRWLAPTTTLATFTTIHTVNNLYSIKLLLFDTSSTCTLLGRTVSVFVSSVVS